MVNAEVQIIPSYQMTDYDAVLKQLYQKLASKVAHGRVDKIEFISHYFLGKPYLNGALGEGPDGEFDQSPQYRTDTFDCVTFVNTVLALAISKHVGEFRQTILRVNYYQANPRYEKRYHVMSVDWNIQNTKIGLVKEVTTQIKDSSGNPLFLMASTLIDRPNWFTYRTMADIKLLKPITNEEAQERLRRLHALSDSVDSEQSELPYLPLTALFKNDEPDDEILNQIPSGSIIQIVRPNWNLRDQIGTNLHISHVGFGFRVDGRLIFRHASSSAKSVIDEPLVDYLKNRCAPNETIKGIHVLQV